MATPARPPTAGRRPARTSELVRFATAGSVDDGKSTLIGRLLYDTKSIFEDQLEHVEADLEAARRRLREPRAAHRRPARRARAGHHDRRRLPLLRTRRGASSSSPTRPGHEQYTRNMVTGRLDRRPRAGPRRRAQGRARAVPPARVHRVAAAHPAPGRVRQQDGPGRLRRRRSSTRIAARVHRLRGEARHPRTSPSSRSRRCTATTSSTAPRTCRGTRARRCSTTSSTCTSPPTATCVDARFPVQ